MKYQKAKSTIHQHRIAKEKLDAVTLQEQEALATVRELEKGPKEIGARQESLSIRLASLDEERVKLIEEIAQCKALTRTVPEALKTARHTHAEAVLRVQSATRQVEKWAKDLPTALAVEASSQERERERRKEINAMIEFLKNKQEAINNGTLKEFDRLGNEIKDLTGGLGYEEYAIKKLRERERSSKDDQLVRKGHLRHRIDAMGNSPRSAEKVSK